jgi:hypothetical protein
MAVIVEKYSGSRAKPMSGIGPWDNLAGRPCGSRGQSRKASGAAPMAADAGSVNLGRDSMD